MTLESKIRRCRRCGREWVSRGGTEPRRCPGCHTICWNREPLPNGGEQRSAKVKRFNAAELPTSDPRTVMADLAEIDQVLKAAKEGEETVPAGLILVSEAAALAGVDEQRVRDRALMQTGVARLRKLPEPDGRWVVSREWFEARMKKAEA